MNTPPTTRHTDSSSKTTAAATSLREQLSRSLLGWIGVFWLVTALGSAWYVRGEINETFDSALQESAWRLLDLVAHELNEQGIDAHNLPGMSTTVAPHNTKVEHNYLMYQVVHRNGELLLRSTDAPSTPLPVGLNNGFSNTGNWRVYTLMHPVIPVHIHVADPLSHRREATREVALGLLLPLAILLPLLLMLVQRITRRALASIDRLALEIGQRDGQHLTAIDAGALPTELATIQTTTNRLLERLANALDTERALAANAAHELRTPLATLRLRLANLQDHPLAPETQAELHQAMVSLDHLSRRTEKLLQLSRAESSTTLTRAPVHLATVAVAVVQDFWSNPDLAQRLQLELPDDQDDTTQPDAWALGDVDAIAIALRNLIENAVRYAPSGPITLRIDSPARLTITDHGPGMAPDQIGDLSRRHQRGDSSRLATPGFGLGLSIVSTIAHRMAGQFALQSPPPGQSSGLQATLTLTPIPQPLSPLSPRPPLAAHAHPASARPVQPGST
jgi:two-component system, OmpR family, sensor kinase